MNNQNNQKWDTSYEWKVVSLLTLGFGLVGLDRWIIAPLLPVISKDLNLNYDDAGLILGTVGITWGIFCIIAGSISDKVGHRKILIAGLVFFSLASGLTSFASGLMSLVLIRALMGISEGAFCPTSFTATAAAAKPSRRGTLGGLQQCGYALFGMGIGPILATQLLLVVPSWRYIFWIVGIPGLILAVFLYKVLKEPEETQGGKLLISGKRLEAGVKAKWYEPIKSRNIVLSMISLFCTMSCVFVVSAMVPLYLENYLNLSTQQQGLVTSAIGFGGFLGQFLVPTVSDWIGRKLTCTVAFLGTTIFVILFSNTGANIPLLFGLLFILSFFSFGLVAILAGPISAESAPAGLVAASIGLVVGAGEIFGGGIAPIITGFIASTYGIQYIFILGLAGAILGFVLSFFLKETAPKKVAKSQTANAIQL